jgi:hypothetical protein
MWWRDNIGCTSWKKCRCALWFATQQKGISWSLGELHHICSQFGLVQWLTAHGTFRTQSGNFLTRPRVSHTKKQRIRCLYRCTFWQELTLNHFLADAAEQRSIMAGINMFAMNTTIKMVRHNSPPRGDYVHITGEDKGCWSYLGRIGGVSNSTGRR